MPAAFSVSIVRPKTRGTPGGGGSGRPRGSGWVTPRHKRPHAVVCDVGAGRDVRRAASSYVAALAIRPLVGGAGHYNRIAVLRPSCFDLMNFGPEVDGLPALVAGSPVGTSMGSRTPSGREPGTESEGRSVTATPCAPPSKLQRPTAIRGPGEARAVRAASPARPSERCGTASAHRLASQDFEDGRGQVARVRVAPGRRPG